MVIQVKLYPFAALKSVAPRLCNTWATAPITWGVRNQAYDDFAVDYGHRFNPFAVTEKYIGRVLRLAVIDQNCFQVAEMTRCAYRIIEDYRSSV